MKQIEIKYLYELDDETLPLITAQIRMNPQRIEAMCITHKNVTGYLTNTFGIDEKVVEELAVSYLNEPLNQLNNALKKLIEISSKNAGSKVEKDLKE